MTKDDLVDRLSEHRTLGSAPRGELEWLATHATLRELAPGELLSTKSKPVEGLYVLLSGRVGMYVDRGAGRHKIVEWRGGDITGVLPYSRLKNPPGEAMVEEPTEILRLPREQLLEVILNCHQITTLLVHVMLDRARAFNASELHDEKMISLGKLSAGLAHELNNPAAAIERSAALLDERLADAEAATRALGAARLSDAQLLALDQAREACVNTQSKGVRSPIEEAERVEAIADWLADHGSDESISEALAETKVTLEALDQLGGVITGPALNAVLRWVAAGCLVRSLASEIQDASMRISSLVSAIKGFTHMDQAMVAAPVDLSQGLGDTVAVLGAKAKAKSIAVTIDVAPGLQRVRGFAGELNQIWANLIDNALDAVPESGRVEVIASGESDHAVIRIVDNGGGIPADVRERIFDPFFTTKPMGQGTGLGLDIVRRLLRHNDGNIEVESKPGRTEFRVTLPLAADDGSGEPQ